MPTVCAKEVESLNTSIYARDAHGAERADANLRAAHDGRGAASSGSQLTLLAQPGRKQWRCANCGGAHKSWECDKLCGNCGYAVCGHLHLPGGCPVGKGSKLPPRETIIDKTGKPIPPKL